MRFALLSNFFAVHVAVAIPAVAGTSLNPTDIERDALDLNEDGQDFVIQETNGERSIHSFQDQNRSFMGTIVANPTFRVLASEPSIPLVDFGSTPPAERRPLQRCQGDCDTDSDCDVGLRCFQRGSNEAVPGCSGGTSNNSRSDYCVTDENATSSPAPQPMPSPVPQETDSPVVPDTARPSMDVASTPTKDPMLNSTQDSTTNPATNPTALAPIFTPSLELSVVPVTPSPTTYTPTPTPTSTPAPAEIPTSIPSVAPSSFPFSIVAPVTSPRLASTLNPRITGFGSNPPPAHRPLGLCQGDCDRDEDCEGDFICFQRDAHGDVPGCSGGAGDSSRSDFCVVDPSKPPNPPIILPRYMPGILTANMEGLFLSQGLDAKIIARSGQRVRLHDGGESSERFHALPDGAATFSDGNGGWAYTSNSEVRDRGQGSVGSIFFDRDGNVVGYKRVLTGSTHNCSGGRTPHNTWVSCEETNGGQIWQVDPFGRRSAKKTRLAAGGNGGYFESFAFDVRDANRPRFFVTEDAPRGALRRFTPNNPNQADPWDVLHVDGVIDYLVLHGGSSSGTFTWTRDRNAARNNAESRYRHTEGIDVRGSQLFFVCKEIRRLFILDLDNERWQSTSTRSGLFDGHPDQVKRIVGSNSDMLYFTEEGGRDPGIHARDGQGRFFTILESYQYNDETTGLAFSPGGRFMFVAFQEVGIVYMVWRVDGQSFDSQALDVKFHHT